MGSNGARLLLGELFPYRSDFRERFSIPMGQEAFEYGEFRERSFEQAFTLFENLEHTMRREKVEHCLCVATSAFRDAKNSSRLVEAVAEKFNLTINVIDGQLESRLVLKGIYREVDCSDTYVLIDIGGGSTEVVLARGEEPIETLSSMWGPYACKRKVPPKGKNSCNSYESKSTKKSSPISPTPSPSSAPGETCGVWEN